MLPISFVASLSLAVPAQEDSIELESFRTSLRQPLTVAFVSADRRVGVEVVERAVDEWREKAGEFPILVVGDGWGDDERKELADDGVTVAIVLTRVKVKKGKTQAHDFGSSFLSSDGKNVQYTGAKVDATYDMFVVERGGESSDWERVWTWETTSDHRKMPHSIDRSDIVDGKVVVNAETIVGWQGRRTLRRGVSAASRHAIDVPHDRHVDWVRSFSADEEAEFWRRARAVSPAEAPLDWRGLNSLARARREEIGENAPSVTPHVELAKALDRYVLSDREHWRKSINQVGVATLHRAGGRTVMPDEMIFVQTESVPEGLISNSCFPDLVLARVQCFDDTDTGVLKDRGLSGLVRKKGALRCRRKRGKWTVTDRLDPDEVTATKLWSWVADVARPRWPDRR